MLIAVLSFFIVFAAAGQTAALAQQTNKSNIALRATSLKDAQRELLGKEIKFIITRERNKPLHMWFKPTNAENILSKQQDVSWHDWAPSHLLTGIIKRVDDFGPAKLPFKRYDEVPMAPGDTKLLVVAELEDKRLVYTAGYFSQIIGHRMYVPGAKSAFEDSLFQDMQIFKNMTLFNGATSTIYNSDETPTTLRNKLSDWSRRGKSGLENLTPMKVESVEHLPDDDAVFVRVVLPDGSRYVLFGALEGYLARKKRGDELAAQLGLDVTAKPQSKFTSRELKAIKEGIVFRGMSWEAVNWSWGTADGINDFGRGGFQLRYGEVGRGVSFLYINGERVTDWQRIN